jgi:hypothetical protein
VSEVKEEDYLYECEAYVGNGFTKLTFNLPTIVGDGFLMCECAKEFPGATNLPIPVRQHYTLVKEDGGWFNRETGRPFSCSKDLAEAITEEYGKRERESVAEARVRRWDELGL